MYGLCWQCMYVNLCYEICHGWQNFWSLNSVAACSRWIICNYSGNLSDVCISGKDGSSILLMYHAVLSLMQTLAMLRPSILTSMYMIICEVADQIELFNGCVETVILDHWVQNMSAKLNQKNWLKVIWNASEKASDYWNNDDLMQNLDEP